MNKIRMNFTDQQVYTENLTQWNINEKVIIFCDLENKKFKKHLNVISQI